MKKQVLIAMLFAAGGLALLTVVPGAKAATNYTLGDVQTHNTATNCWLINNNQVYNLTNYISNHPGGATAITNLCGTNATAAIAAQHGTSAPVTTILASNLIGQLIVSDTQSPSTPMNLAVSTSTANSIKLNWTAATDNIGVTGYLVYRNSVLIGQVNTPAFNNYGLSASTTYQYAVVALDAAGNKSATSSVLAVTTPVKATGTPIVKPCHHDDDDGDDKDEHIKKQNHGQFISNLRHTRNEARKMIKNEKKHNRD